MFDIESHITKLFADPAHASRTVVTSLLIVAVTAFGWNAGSGQLSASLLRGDAIDVFGNGIDYVDPEEAKKSTMGEMVINEIGDSTDNGGDSVMQAESGNNDGATFDTNIGSTGCATTDQADAFMAAFNESFRGPPPGIGEFLDTYPSEVADLQDKLIAKVTEKYAKIKYCIEPAAFQMSPSGASLTTYLGDEGDNFAVVIDALDASQANLADIRGQITIAIDDAIKAAKSSDNSLDAAQTKLSSGTQTKIVAMQTALLDVNNEINNRMIEQNNNTNDLLRKQALLLNRLADFASWDHRKDPELGGTKYEKPVLNDDDVTKPEIMYAEQAEFDTSKRDLDGLEESVTEATSETSAVGTKDARFHYGLLNLLTAEHRAEYLAEAYKVATTEFFAADNNVDVQTPGQEYRNYAAHLPTPTAESYADALCESAEGACFGF